MTDTTDDIAEEISFQSFEDDCRLLGSLLNEVLQREVGHKIMDKFERNRVLAQSACNMRMANIEDMAELLEKQLVSEISYMTLDEALTLARAFSHYLNLMGIAETHHRGGVSPDELYETVCKQEVEIVPTAHPTQINRRTLQNKHIRIAHLLEYNDRPDLSHEDREMLVEDLVREITSIWQTDELRRHKPTPVDEARAGLHVVEQSLWRAMPHYLRRHTGRPLPMTATLIKFGSWMGGDRDGNPNVKSKMIDSLRFELSMNKCSNELSRYVQEIVRKEAASEEQPKIWNQSLNRGQSKNYSPQALALPTQLPAGAALPSCKDGGESQYPRLEFPGSDRQEGLAQNSKKPFRNGNITIPNNIKASSGNVQSPVTPKSGNQLLAQRKLFAESQIGRSSFQKLLEPTLPQLPGNAPYRVFLGSVKDKLMKTRR
ncbi:hypothetical protein MKX01_008699 [Papaver californicum]|nr:hypothetical protein MKX01_008699 [Papaver californicum]